MMDEFWLSSIRSLCELHLERGTANGELARDLLKALRMHEEGTAFYKEYVDEQARRSGR